MFGQKFDKFWLILIELSGHTGIERKVNNNRAFVVLKSLKNN